MTYEMPKFAIIQNSRTKLSFVWTKTKGEWVEFPVQDYEHLRLLAELIRTDPDPVAIMETYLPGETYSGDEKLTSPEEVKKKKKATAPTSSFPLAHHWFFKV